MKANTMTPKEKALAYLANIQKGYIEEGGKTPLGYNTPYKHKLENFIGVSNAINNNKPLYGEDSDPLSNYHRYIHEHEKDFTELETRGSIYLLANLVDDMKAVWKISKLPFPENVVIGTTQFGQINAQAISPGPDSDFKIILIDDGLFPFINSLSKIVSCFIPIEKGENNISSFELEENNINGYLEGNPAMHDAFVKLVTSYVIYGHAATSPFVKVSDEHLDLVAILNKTAELFVIAHEYGHIMCNHFSNSRRQERKLCKEMNAETWVLDWAKEFQADEYACISVIRFNHIIKDMDAEISFVGIAYFFAAIDILYKAIHFDFPSDYPPPDHRIIKLYQSIEKDSEDKELVEDMLKLSRNFSGLMSRLFERNCYKIWEIIQSYRMEYLNKHIKVWEI